MVTQHRYRSLNPAGSFLLGLVLAVFCIQVPAQAIQIEKTLNKHKDFVETNLLKHLYTVSRVSNGAAIHLTVDGGYRLEKLQFQEGLVEFTCPLQGRFYGPPDHHVSLEFTVVKIGATEAIFQYKSEFDHRSFGKDLISVDTGEIQIGYFDR